MGVNRGVTSAIVSRKGFFIFILHARARGGEGGGHSGRHLARHLQVLVADREANLLDEVDRLDLLRLELADAFDVLRIIDVPVSIEGRGGGRCEDAAPPARVGGCAGGG